MGYISALTKNDKVIVWERNDEGERIVKTHDAPYYFYYDDPDGEYRTIFDTPVSKIEFKSGKQFHEAKKDFANKNLKTWESDISPELRWLSNEYYNKPAPKLNITFCDIEVDYNPMIGFSSPIDPYAPINSITILHRWKKQIVVIAIPPDDTWTAERLSRKVIESAPDAPVIDTHTLQYILCEDETELLLHIIKQFADSDVISGWNSSFFDLPYIAQRISRVLDNTILDFSTTESFNGSGKPTVAFVNNPNNAITKCTYLKKLDFPTFGMPSAKPVTSQAGTLLGVSIDLVGRVHLDYMNLVKKYEPGEKSSYKLATISNEILVDSATGLPTLPKLEYEGSLADLYRNNFAFFIRYNIRDTEILEGFENKLGYVELANQMAHISTAQFTHIGGTLKLAELALINYCHHKLKRVVNNITAPDVDKSIDGALVLLPQVGLHEKIASIDVNSLYPNSIRSLNISPETIRGQFVGELKDGKAISAGGFTSHTMVDELTKQETTMTADQWRDYFSARKWAVSTYGTVFDQTKQGFIPAILEEWYIARKQYQKKKATALESARLIKAKYQ